MPMPNAWQQRRLTSPRPSWVHESAGVVYSVVKRLPCRFGYLSMAHLQKIILHPSLVVREELELSAHAVGNHAFMMVNPGGGVDEHYPGIEIWAEDLGPCRKGWQCNACKLWVVDVAGKENIGVRVQDALGVQLAFLKLLSHRPDNKANVHATKRADIEVWVASCAPSPASSGQLVVKG
eukprot:CAMPEP_0115832022 /NCGR_PEP_ID=MMETSP0287-20121206/2441_1 /TAXON_ID=412157 /ORGANISM="Chrysochromulina rotalis, Strain UIO044" /LENGTH=178 /DNA_ID=CAMNT_0003285389 /DNA_START=383 /DNA_END=919 /DNA_ORIENTATION=+